MYVKRNFPKSFQLVKLSAFKFLNNFSELCEFLSGFHSFQVKSGGHARRLNFKQLVAGSLVGNKGF